MGLDKFSTTKADLLAAAVTALTAANTLAGVRVYDPNTLPVSITTFPALTVSAPSERKNADGGRGGTPKFNSTIALAIMARVVGVGFNAQAKQLAAQTSLDQLVAQVEMAILCAPAMTTMVQEFEFVETHAIVSMSGEDCVGEATAVFGCQVWQHYTPDYGDPLTDIVTTMQQDGAGPTLAVDTPLPQ